MSQTIRNPVQRVGFELGSDIAVQDLARNLSRDHGMTSRSSANSEPDCRARSCFGEATRGSRQQTWTKDTRHTRNSMTQTFFGAIITTTKTRLLRSEFVDDDALEDDDYQYEHESYIRVLPARWLLKLGFNYAYNLSTHSSSTHGWQFCARPINLVPDDAPIFEFSVQGNIERVRDLISRDLASVRDVNSKGETALHVSHVALDYLPSSLRKMLWI